MVVHMSNYFWCHGPECHQQRTVDRIRGRQGSQVLRTRKIKQHTNSHWYNLDASHNYFCSQSCQTHFWNKHARRIIALEPRTEPLETSIEVEKKSRERVRYNWSERDGNERPRQETVVETQRIIKG